MKNLRYVCTHCGRKFEHEEKDIVECPGCLWTSSVKKEDEVETKPKFNAPAPAKKSFLSSFRIPWKPILIFLGIVIVLVLLFPFVRKGIEGLEKTLPKESIKIAPTLEEEEPKAIIWEQLSTEEINVLNRRLTVDPNRAFTEAEGKVLNQEVALKTGVVQKLPTPAWTLENFKELLAKQEKFYRMPLSRSYKKKLEKVFEAKYPSGIKAFERGNLLGARDLWMESLIFPVYDENLDKHRGVVLTMIRPFINDTLSKIGALNHMLMEKETRLKEEQINLAYGRLITQLAADDRQAALQTIKGLKEQLKVLQQFSGGAAKPPAYSASIQGVDRDIQFTLYDLLNAPAPAVADVEPMRRDLERKAKILESLRPGYAQGQQYLYDQAMDAISQKNAEKAIEILQSVEGPLPLANDAREKVKILRKNIQPKT